MECDKEIYQSIKDATKAIVGKWKDAKVKLDWYKCDRCGGIHLTTVRKNPQHRPSKVHSHYTYKENPKNPIIKNPLPQVVKPQSFIHSTQKAISEEQANYLKQLINKNQNEK